MDIGDAATWVAAGIAFVSALFTVWWPLRNRPQASWFVQKFDMTSGVQEAYGLLGWHTHDGLSNPEYVLDIMNDGDGSGFDVSVDATGAELRIINVTILDDGRRAIAELPNIHVVRPGEKLRAVGWNNVESENISLRIHWTLQPTRLQNRVYHEIALKGEIEDQPWKPIPEAGRKGPSLVLYRFRHSRVGGWSYKKLDQLRQVLHHGHNQQEKNSGETPS